jgi:DNA-binding transcriptional regulator YiaG
MRLQVLVFSIIMWPIDVPETLFGQSPDSVIYDGLFGREGQLMPLLTHRIVREEIEMSRSQHDTLIPHIAKWRASFNRKRISDQNDQTKWIDIIDDVLLPHQINRLNQIHWQAMGIHALGSPHFARRLGISRDQAKAYERLQKKTPQEYQQYIKNLEATKNRSKVARDFKQKLSDRVKDLLDEKQWKKLIELMGKPFDLERLGPPRY